MEPILLNRPPQAPPASEVSGAEKPTLTTRQANWHVHATGMAAQAVAEQAGCDPSAAASLLSAGSQMIIGGIAFPPIHAAYLLLLPAMNTLIEKDEMLNNEGFQLMAMAFSLAEPKRSWSLMRSQSAEWPEAVFAFAERFTLGDLQKLGHWINGELGRMQDQAEVEGVGKSEPPPSAATSPA